MTYTVSVRRKIDQIKIKTEPLNDADLNEKSKRKIYQESRCISERVSVLVSLLLLLLLF